MRAEPSLFLWLVKTPSRAEPARSGSRAGSRARPNMAQAGPEGKSYLIPYLLQSARSHGLKDAGDMHHVMFELVIFQLHNIYILILDDANDVNMARTLCCCPSTAASSASSFEGRAEPGSARSCAEPSLARLGSFPALPVAFTNQGLAHCTALGSGPCDRCSNPQSHLLFCSN